MAESDVAKIIVMRGLGYSQSEIAKEVGVTQGAVSYNLKQLRGIAEKEGLEGTYVRLLAAGGKIDSLKRAGLI